MAVHSCFGQRAVVENVNIQNVETVLAPSSARSAKGFAFTYRLLPLPQPRKWSAAGAVLSTRFFVLRVRWGCPRLRH